MQRTPTPPEIAELSRDQQPDPTRVNRQRGSQLPAGANQRPPPPLYGPWYPGQSYGYPPNRPPQPKGEPGVGPHPTTNEFDQLRIQLAQMQTSLTEAHQMIQQTRGQCTPTEPWDDQPRLDVFTQDYDQHRMSRIVPDHISYDGSHNDVIALVRFLGLGLALGGTSASYTQIP